MSTRSSQSRVLKQERLTRRWKTGDQVRDQRSHLAESSGISRSTSRDKLRPGGYRLTLVYPTFDLTVLPRWQKATGTRPTT